MIIINEMMSIVHKQSETPLPLLKNRTSYDERTTDVLFFFYFQAALTNNAIPFLPMARHHILV